MFYNLNANHTKEKLINYQITIKKPRGLIIEIYFDPEYTKFNLNDYIKLSKKVRRSEKLIDKEKPLLQYSMTGKCLFFRKRGANSSFTLRNVVDLISFELCYPLFTPTITFFAIHKLYENQLALKYKRTTNYQYRWLSPNKARVKFFFVVDEVKNIAFVDESNLY